jgi:hypothetical protein
LDVKPNESILIDDHKVNINAAERIGIRGIQFEDAMKLEESLKSLGI